jgi:hypothetical protein
VRILRVLRFVVGVEARRIGQVRLAIHHLDILARLFRGRRRHARRVGAHVGDETYGALVADLYSFVEILRQSHRALRSEAEFFCRVLLQRAGRERRRRIFPPLTAFDLSDLERLA